ncbi:hypothetical protein [Burkholderia sp. BCC1985]|uniref:hypothetical protein n=1 Tax=Burkholderia sp. BCC1985 TaxID=2817442 RepID=UPI002AAFD96D|nr:hypothetical protein [Burkholderia sp. BCC1985]
MSTPPDQLPAVNQLFQQNASRIDTFVNGAPGTSYTTTSGEQVLSLPSIVGQINATDAIAKTQANVSASSANANAAAISAAQAFASIGIQNVLGSVPAALPYEVTAISGGVGTGSGGTPGTYAGGVSGGPAGFQWSYTIGSGGTLAGYAITNPGISTSNVAPTLSFPSGGLTGATVPTATVGTIPVNRVFAAPSSDGSQLLAWGNNSGTLATAPFGSTQTSLVTAALIQSVAGRRSVSIADQAGNLICRISAELIEHPDIDAIRDQAAYAVAQLVGAVFGQSSTGHPSNVLQDQSANAIKITSQTQVEHPVIEAMQDQLAYTQSQLPPDYSAADFIADVNHIIGYGQSLMEGDHATPAISTVTRSYAKMFVGGVRPSDGGSTVSTMYGTTFSAMVENSSGRNSSGETPLSGCVDMIAQLLLAENGVDLTQSGQWKMLGSDPAMGGQSQAALSPGGTYWTDWQNNITYGAANALAAGLSYAPVGAIHSQGEADYNAGTPKEQWKAGQIAMLSAMTSWAQGATGNKRPLPMIMAQTMTHLAAGKTVPTIAMAQEELSREQQWMAMFPIHFMTYYTDNIHLINTSQRWQGGYFGLFLKRMLIDKVKLAPLSPTRIERFGSDVILTFPVRAGLQLAWDTSFNADPGNYGFTILDTYRNALTQSAAPRIIEPNKVVITPASGKIGFVQCGFIGNGYKGVTCLRDTSSLIFDPSGINKPMYMWAPIFERKVS